MNDTFDTVEECIQDALTDECINDYDSVYIGEIEQWHPSLDGTWILEQIEEQAYHDVGEYAETWGVFESLNKDDINELGESLTSFIKSWFYNKKCYPNIGSIVNIKGYALSKGEDINNTR